MFKSLLLSLMIAVGLPAQDTVVVLLRHAEKVDKGDTSPLSEAGHRRADQLVAQLIPFEPSALFASNRLRTQQTIEPLSRALSIPLQIYERGEEQALGKRILAQYSRQHVIICGHSDNLRVLVEALGHRIPFPEVTDFDRYWVLRVTEGSGTVTLQEFQQKPMNLPSPLLVPTGRK